MLCKGVLILNPASLRQHIISKRHLTRLKGTTDLDAIDPICFAEDVQVSDFFTEASFLWLASISILMPCFTQSETDEETHEERRQRTRNLLVEGALPKHKGRRSAQAKRVKRKRPGKRQRLLLRSGAAEQPQQPAAGQADEQGAIVTANKKKRRKV